MNSNVLICYIDEYRMSEQDFHLYNWVPKGEDNFLYSQLRKPGINIIAAVTGTQVVTLHVRDGYNRAEDFRLFLVEAIEILKYDHLQEG